MSRDRKLSRFFDHPSFRQLAASCPSVSQSHIEPDNVFLEGNPKSRKVLNSLVASLMLPGSGILNSSRLADLDRLADDGAACLILAEHVSNADYPGFYHLAENDPLLGAKFCEKLIAILGIKLLGLEGSVGLLSTSFPAIVICPSRHDSSKSQKAKYYEEQAFRQAVNQAAVREIFQRRNSGHIVMVFPSGTRYRPWKPDSSRGVREIYNYLRLFDKMVLISINGIVLIPHPSENMELDPPNKDVLLFNVSPIYDCAQFLKEKAKEAPSEIPDNRQHVVDSIMKALEALHQQTEKQRLPLLKQAGGSPFSWPQFLSELKETGS